MKRRVMQATAGVCVVVSSVLILVWVLEGSPGGVRAVAGMLCGLVSIMAGVVCWRSTWRRVP